MSVKTTTLFLSLVLTTPAMAEKPNVYGPKDPAYILALNAYGKEMLASNYSSHLCPETIIYNDDYFQKDPPPILWSQESFDQFMKSVMTVTKNKIDAHIAKMGKKEYCAGFIEFIEDNYPPNNSPIKVRR